jgi:hypothetical protein
VLQHGLLKGSFVPPPAIRELRDLTRYRVNLAEKCNRIANRIQKVLEDANIKLASGATDALGASGRAMLKAMIEGEENAEVLAEMSKGLLRKKMPELRRALEGRTTVHQRFSLQELMDHLEFVETKRLRLEEQIAKRTQPFEDAVRRLRQIPGVDRITASALRSLLNPWRKQPEVIFEGITRFDKHWRRKAYLLILLFGAPVDEVAGVEGDAEEIGRDEAELGGADADDADNGAIDTGDDPALPEFLTDQHGGEHGQHAG